MIDLLFLWGGIEIFLLICFLALKGNLRLHFPKILFSISVAMMFFYPLFFDQKISMVKQSNLTDVVLGEPLVPVEMGKPLSYFSWRNKLEVGGKINLLGANNKQRSLEIKPKKIPWWYPNVEGDEFELSQSIGYGDLPPIGYETLQTLRQKEYPGRPIRIFSIAGKPVQSRAEAVTAIQNTVQEKPVRMSYFREDGRYSRPIFMPTKSGSLITAVEFFNLYDSRVSAISQFGRLLPILELNGRKIFSPLAFFFDAKSNVGATIRTERGLFVAEGSGKGDVSRAFGFIYGPRVFEVSLINSLRATFAALMRMTGFHGHGAIMLVTEHLITIPKVWYLLPLESYWQLNYLYYRIFTIFLATAFCLAILGFLPNNFSQNLNRVSMPLVFFFTLLMVMNDVWVTVLL